MASSASASAFLGSTLTHLRGLGLGAEVDDDELRRGDEILLVPEPSNPRDPNAVTAVTPEGLLVGRVNKRHAAAGFCRMLASITRQSIRIQATIHSISPLPNWGGDREETSVVHIDLSFFGTPSMVPLLRRLVQHHGLRFHAASPDASTPTPAEAGAGAAAASAVQAAAVVTSSSSLTSASREGSARGSTSAMAGEVVDLTEDSDTD